LKYIGPVKLATMKIMTFLTATTSNVNLVSK